MPATELQVYDFETAIETAIASMFTAAGVKVYTTADDPELRRDRPRIELQAILGAATGHLQPITLDGATRNVYDAHDAVLQISAYTKASPAEHAEYRARLRAIMSRVIFLELDYHEIAHVHPGGTSPVLRPEDGVYESRLAYNLHVCVKHDAWPTT